LKGIGVSLCVNIAQPEIFRSNFVAHCQIPHGQFGSEMRDLFEKTAKTVEVPSVGPATPLKRAEAGC